MAEACYRSCPFVSPVVEARNSLQAKKEEFEIGLSMEEAASDYAQRFFAALDERIKDIQSTTDSVATAAEGELLRRNLANTGIEIQRSDVSLNGLYREWVEISDKALAIYEDDIDTKIRGCARGHTRILGRNICGSRAISLPERIIMGYPKEED